MTAFRWAVGMVAVAAFCGAGCAMFNSTRVSYSRNVTVGQELIDLKKALDGGAITAAEYEDLKARVKKSVDTVETGSGNKQ